MITLFTSGACFSPYAFTWRAMTSRHVIEHVKAQSWTAIAIDFVIAMIGVFIGIQV